MRSCAKEALTLTGLTDPLHLLTFYLLLTATHETRGNFQA